MTVSTAILVLLVGLLAGWMHLVGRRKIEAARGRAQQTSDLHLATIEALARAIDAKDQTAEQHIQRVQAYALGLAKAVGVTGVDLKGIETAALLHDIGKLAVPEHILSKPGPLTAEEFQKVRIHSQVGADILAAVPFPYPVASLIRSHHERWDGTGYPAGLTGETIPIGARILAVVDYFDAVTTDRPYHKALSLETGIALLQHEAGKALDPHLVATFVDLAPWFIQRFAGPVPRAPEMPKGAPVARATPSAGSRNVFEDIALAHRELYALYEIAQSMGTSLGVGETMALISSKIANIVPWSSCALFLFDAAADTLTCRYAAGTDATLLTGLVRPAGTGLSGGVARHRRTLVRASRLEGDPIDLPDVTFESALICPLIVNDRFVGTLALYHAEPNRYTDDHRRLLEQVAEQAGAVIQNSIVFEKTQVDSLTDPLTGLPNRRSLFAHVTRELARAGRLKSEAAVIVMDIDGLKAINDSCGHHVGDRALRDVAGVLHASLRPYDLCVRYAGDEFVVVLSDCSREAADTKQRELQQRISEIEIETRPGERIRLAASAGVSVYPHDGTTHEALLADADFRMYRDKALRRGQPPPQPISPEGPFVANGAIAAEAAPSTPAPDPTSSSIRTV